MVDSHDTASASTRPAPGTPIWWDLASEDVAATQRFYRGLLGWQWRDVMSGPDGVYAMATVGGKAVGGVYTFKPGMPEPPGKRTWVHQLWVDDAVTAVARAAAAGATVVFEPCDDPAFGGLKSLLLLPEGQPIVVWQGDGDDGISPEAFGEVGAACWVELYSRDVAAVNKAFQASFGFQFARVEMTRPAAEWESADGGEIPFEYHWLRVPGADAPRGGMMAMDASWGDMPAHWMLYFRVTDCDAAAAHAAELGGTVCVPPTDIAIGRFSVLDDPHGATFSIIALANIE